MRERKKEFNEMGLNIKYHERERERVSLRENGRNLTIGESVSVCVFERERESERESVRLQQALLISS